VATLTNDRVMGSADFEPTVQRPQSDWTDQDLLTKSEARERLIVEIARTRGRLEELRGTVGDPARIDAETTLLTRRLNAMQAVRDEYGPAKGTP
jgi:hypothetical protein